MLYGVIFGRVIGFWGRSLAATITSSWSLTARVDWYCVRVAHSGESGKFCIEDN
jgi:hypothetical protein